MRDNLYEIACAVLLSSGLAALGAERPSLANDAGQLAKLGKDGWASGPVAVHLNKKKEQVRLLLRFEPKQGQAKGRAKLGLTHVDKKGKNLSTIWVGYFDFEIVEKKEQRRIEILNKVGSKLIEILKLEYTLGNDRLQVRTVTSLDWGGTGAIVPAVQNVRFRMMKP